MAGGLLTLATASDGGGSIRIPAGFCGLVGLKATFGRIPNSPDVHVRQPDDRSYGCVSRSVRDTARWFDVANGHDPRDPLSLPRVEGWEAGLGTLADALRGLRVAVVADWGGAVVSPAMWELLEQAADALIDDAGLRARRRRRHRAAADGRGLVDQRDDRHRRRARRPLAGLRRRPHARDPRTAWQPSAGQYYGRGRARIEQRRMEVNEAMARIFDPVDGVDLVITASNPDVAFAADGPLPDTFGGVEAGPATTAG